MALVVVKFGGTSVGDVARIANAAAKVAAEVKRGNKIAVVVSAMSGVTDQLLGYCHQISSRPDRREQDAVVSSGEQVTAGLMAIALQSQGLQARSWQGWQVPLRTDAAHTKARIVTLETDGLRQRIEDGEVAVMAGFQGVTEDGSIATLGRGGSDTSAVALAAALKADRCDIYTDVDGIYTTDPRIVPAARKLHRVTSEEMLELASLGAKVLQTRSVEMAMRYRVPVQVLSTFDAAIGSDFPGTLMTDEDPTMEQQTVTGIAYSRHEAKLTLVGVEDHPGAAAAVFGPLAKAGISVGMIVQTASASEDDRTTDITFTVPRGEADHATHVLDEARASLRYGALRADKNVAKISIVGLGMRSHPGVAAMLFETLAARGINIQAIETSEISLGVLIAEEYTELALRALHTAYGLDAVESSREG